MRIRVRVTLAVRVTVRVRSCDLPHLFLDWAKANDLRGWARVRVQTGGIQIALTTRHTGGIQEAYRRHTGGIREA